MIRIKIVKNKTKFINFVENLKNKISKFNKI